MMPVLQRLGFLLRHTRWLFAVLGAAYSLSWLTHLGSSPWWLFLPQSLFLWGGFYTLHRQRKNTCTDLTILLRARASLAAGCGFILGGILGYVLFIAIANAISEQAQTIDWLREWHLWTGLLLPATGLSFLSYRFFRKQHTPRESVQIH